MLHPRQLRITRDAAALTAGAPLTMVEDMKVTNTTTTTRTTTVSGEATTTVVTEVKVVGTTVRPQHFQ